MRHEVILDMSRKRYPLYSNTYNRLQEAIHSEDVHRKKEALHDPCLKYCELTRISNSVFEFGTRNSLNY